MYGDNDNPVRPFWLRPELLEIPPSVWTWGPLRVPYGGGFYFRLYPAWLTRKLIDSDHRGGKTPVILIQNTGLMEAGDSLRGWGLGLNLPVVLLVGYRGWTRHGVTTDTAAVYVERFLNAFGISYYLVENNQDAPRISLAFEEARKTMRPVAVLVGDEYHGFNR